MSSLKAQIHDQDDFIRSILAISNCPALSLGIISQGQIVHSAHYGTREIGQQLPPDDDTIYRIASLTKSLTASAVAALVEDGLLNWDAPVREYLPQFEARQDDIGVKATLRDLLSNRTGLAAGDFYWGQQHGEFLLPHNELVRMAVHCPAVQPFRKRFVYASWNYGLVTEVVEAVTGMTLGKFIELRFLTPLGMGRTTLADTSARDNVALGYGMDTDGSCHKLRFQQMNDGIGLAGAYGAKSSLKDLLTWYRELMKAKQDQSQRMSRTTLGSPLVQTKEIFESHIPVFGTTSYCLGLYKTVLPGTLGLSSLNTVAWLGMKQSPIMGASLKDTEVWHHTGSMPAGMATALLVPKSHTAIVVLSSSLGYLDPTDFVAQQLLAVVLGEKPNEKLIDLAKIAKARNLNNYPKLLAKLMQGYSGRYTRPRKSYEGHYWNNAGNMCLTISLQASAGLRMKVQDLPLTGYDLEPYDGDMWWWPPDRKSELCEKGMWGFTYPKHHLVSFTSSTGEQIDRLLWQHDPTTSSPEIFVRSLKKPTWTGYSFPKAHL